jgi:hypothetical protein
LLLSQEAGKQLEEQFHVSPHPLQFVYDRTWRRLLLLLQLLVVLARWREQQKDYEEDWL